MLTMTRTEASSDLRGGHGMDWRRFRIPILTASLRVDVIKLPTASLMTYVMGLVVNQHLSERKEMAGYCMKVWTLALRVLYSSLGPTVFKRISMVHRWSQTSCAMKIFSTWRGFGGSRRGVYPDPQGTGDIRADIAFGRACRRRPTDSS